MTLCFTHLRRVAIFPDCALTQEPVGSEPRAAKQQWRPPTVGKQNSRRGQSAYKFNHSRTDKAHGDRDRRAGNAEIKNPGNSKGGGRTRILKTTQPRRAKRPPG